MPAPAFTDTDLARWAERIDGRHSWFRSAMPYAVHRMDESGHLWLILNRDFLPVHVTIDQATSGAVDNWKTYWDRIMYAPFDLRELVGSVLLPPGGDDDPGRLFFYKSPADMKTYFTRMAVFSDLDVTIATSSGRGRENLLRAGLTAQPPCFRRIQ